MSSGSSDGAHTLLLTERNNLSARVNELEALLGQLQLERKDQGGLEDRLKGVEQEREVLKITVSVSTEEKNLYCIHQMWPLMIKHKTNFRIVYKSFHRKRILYNENLKNHKILMCLNLSQLF